MNDERRVNGMMKGERKKEERMNVKKFWKTKGRKAMRKEEWENESKKEEQW